MQTVQTVLPAAGRRRRGPAPPSPTAPVRAGGRRAAAIAALAAVVTALHLWLAGGVLDSRLGDGASNARDNRPRRIDVAFVRELAQAAPPAAAPPVRRQALAAAVPSVVAAAASAAASAASATSAAAAAPIAAAASAAAAVAAAAADEAVAAPSVPSESDAQAASAAQRAAAASAPAVAVAASAAAPAAPVPAVAVATAASAAPAAAFDWPPSTRLSYTLTGHYRGPVQGQAQVEWLRSGTRYQVHLDLTIGAAFAPLAGRRLSSDGDLTEQGLQPRRYDEETRAVLRDTRHATLLFEGDHVRLANGTQVPRPPGVQDAASQFVQLTWLFTTQPQLLQTGRTVVLPLALPRYVDNWTYDVLAAETLDTPAGPVATVHVKPRRAPRPGVELTAEMWVAPSLQYLPVRIVIRQDAETFLDMLISRLPQQATR